MDTKIYFVALDCRSDQQTIKNGFMAENHHCLFDWGTLFSSPLLFGKEMPKVHQIIYNYPLVLFVDNLIFI